MPTATPTAETALASPWLQQAELALPAVDGAIWQGRLCQLPQFDVPPRPLLLFLHGSSGLNNQTREYQRWLAEALGLASLAPDSFAVPDRPRYRSPASTTEYEAVHRIRLAELATALAALPALPWVDRHRLLLAGSSEGAVAVARWRGGQFLGRLIYAWSCEDNYFVARADNGFGADAAILNILSDADPFFGAASPFNRGLAVHGDSRAALADLPRARLVLLPGAPHTLYNLPEAREPARTFIADVLG